MSERLSGRFGVSAKRLACACRCDWIDDVLTAPAFSAPGSTIVSADATFVNTFDCAFSLTETISGAYKDTLYFDAAGNPVKEILTAQYGGPLTVTWTNPLSGKTLSSHEAGP